MKLGPTTKFNKKNTTTMVDLDLSETLIPEACSIIPIFSLIETFYLTKTENTTKKSQAQLSYYCFE